MYKLKVKSKIFLTLLMFLLCSSACVSDPADNSGTNKEVEIKDNNENKPESVKEIGLSEKLFSDYPDKMFKEDVKIAESKENLNAKFTSVLSNENFVFYAADYANKHMQDGELHYVINALNDRMYLIENNTEFLKIQEKTPL